MIDINMKNKTIKFLEGKQLENLYALEMSCQIEIKSMMI